MMKQVFFKYLLLILLVGGMLGCANSDSTSQTDNVTTPVVVTEPEPEPESPKVSRLQLPPSPESYISQL